MQQPSLLDWRAHELRRRVENRARAAAYAANWKEEELEEVDGQVESQLEQPKLQVAETQLTKSPTVLPKLTSTRPPRKCLELVEYEAKCNASLKYFEQHFLMEKCVRSLRSELDLSRRNIRQRKDRLEELESRLVQISKGLYGSSQEQFFAVNQIQQQNELRKDQLVPRKCRICGKAFLSTLLDQHERNCTVIDEEDDVDVEAANSNQEPECARDTNIETWNPKRKPKAHKLKPKIPPFLPQPPRNVKVESSETTHSSFMVRWEDPIFTGSAPVIDYEIHFSYTIPKATARERATRSGSSTARSRVTSPGANVNDHENEVQHVCIQTAAWCLLKPVPTNAFMIENLIADQDYVSIFVITVTMNGKSSSSNVVPLVHTKPVVEPGSPLFFSCQEVFEKSVSLVWMEPFRDGGSPIADYEISFMEAVMEDAAAEDKKSFLDVNDIHYKLKRFRIRSVETSFTVHGLLSGTEHREFQVRAYNCAGMCGPWSRPIATITTLTPMNEVKLLDELQAAVGSTSKVVDSQFLSGFSQRYERNFYIRLVSSQILQVHPELKDKVESILHPELAYTSAQSAVAPSQASPPSHSGPLALVPLPTAKSGVNPTAQMSDEELKQERRRQFRFRISELEQEKKRAEYNLQWCHDRRLDLVSLIHAAETRILEKQAELERAKAFPGSQMDSDVFESGLQRFYTKELVLALEDEIQIEQLYIVDSKEELVQVEKYLRADTKHLDTVTKRIEDRREAYAAFEANGGHILESKNNMAFMSIREGAVYRSFKALVRNCAERRKARGTMKMIIERLATGNLKQAFGKWFRFLWISRREESMGGASSDSAACGRGSASLLDVTLDRGEIKMGVEQLLAQIRDTNNSLQAITETAEQRALRQNDNDSNKHHNDIRCLPLLLKADAQMDVTDYRSALVSYDSILQNEMLVTEMSENLLAEVLLKKGQALFALQDFEPAQVHLSRALATSKRSGNHRIEAQAYEEIGKAYTAMGSMRVGIEYFEKAIEIFELIGDKRGEMRCYRNLEAIFRKMEDRETTEVFKNRADHIEHALNCKLAEANRRLHDLQEQLVGVGAESSKEIDLERVGAIVPRLRKDRIRCKFKAREETKLAESLELLLKEKKALLVKGDEDLKRALASDSSQVDSDVITGSSARFEIDDFKKKLAKLMGAVKFGEDHITREIENSRIRVKNLEEEVRELEAELLVETGTLMRHVISKQRLRCFRFNATNEALKNVIGNASDGVPTCVAAAGLSGYVFDLLTGACLTQAVGDAGKQHLGEAVGHQAQIMCIAYIGKRLYTGAIESCVGVWDILDDALGGITCVPVKFLRDFDAAVMSIAADNAWLAAGSSDCDVLVYDVTSLALLARVTCAHTRTVTCLTLDSANQCFITGAADNKVKQWKLETGASSATALRKYSLLTTLQAQRDGETFFNGHLQPVSVVRQIAREVVSGDISGRVVVWNLDTEFKVMRICDVHQASVTCLQFDATRIVSGDSKGTMCIIDFATGHLLQTLRGHSASILDLQFDRKRLVSMSGDGRVRVWLWQLRIGASSDQKKYHVLAPGETLRSLSLKYRASIKQIMQWNGLANSSALYLGQKLIVQLDSRKDAAEEDLKALEAAYSPQFGKLSLENLEFVTANQVQSEDVEMQWAAQRLKMLAKEYFPPLDDDTKDEEDDTKEQDDGDSDSDGLVAVDEEEEEDAKAQEKEEGDAKEDEEQEEAKANSPAD